MKFFDLQRFGEEPADSGKSPSSGEAKPEFTPEQQDAINKMINAAFAKGAKKAEEESARHAKEKEEAEKLKKLSDDERNLQRIKDLEEKLNSMEKSAHEGAMMSAARSELLERGYSFSDSIIARLVGDDAEKTKANIDEFSKAFDQAVQAAVKKAVPSSVPKSGASHAVTKAEILAIPDTLARQKAMAENMDLFTGAK